MSDEHNRLPGEPDLTGAGPEGSRESHPEREAFSDSGPDEEAEGEPHTLSSQSSSHPPDGNAPVSFEPKGVESQGVAPQDFEAQDHRLEPAGPTEEPSLQQASFGESGTDSPAPPPDPLVRSLPPGYAQRTAAEQMRPYVSDLPDPAMHSDSGATDGQHSLPFGDAPGEETGTPEMAPVAVVAGSDPNYERPRSTLAEWTITIILLLFLTTTLVQAYVIPTGSMEDTLMVGDHLLVDKLSFAPPGLLSQYLLPYTDIERGDIIVFRYPVDISQTFVKRCIGVPGDRIKIVNKEVYLNGVKVSEPYTYHKTNYIDSYRDNFPSEPNTYIEDGAYDMLSNHVVDGEVVVPEGYYFALGDNRDASLDSRYWGFVPRENIIGKPLIIYWSYDAPTDRLNNSSISLDHLIDLGRNFFSKTRWARTFQLIHGYPLEDREQ